MRRRRLGVTLSLILGFFGPTTESSAQPCYPAVVLDAGPIAYWGLDEAEGPVAQDRTVAANHGDADGGVTFGIAGPIARPVMTAAGFDGTGSIFSRAPFNVGQDFTIEAWARVPSMEDHHHLVTLSVDYADSRNLFFDLDANRFSGISNATSSWPQYAVRGAPADPAVWHHLVYTMSNLQNAVFYVDGDPRAELLPSATTFSSLAAIGRCSFCGSGQFGVAEISNVALYDRVLSEEEVLSHFAAARPIGGTAQGAQCCVDADCASGLCVAGVCAPPDGGAFDPDAGSGDDGGSEGGDDGGSDSGTDAGSGIDTDGGSSVSGGDGGSGSGTDGGSSPRLYGVGCSASPAPDGFNALLLGLAGVLLFARSRWRREQRVSARYHEQEHRP